MGVRILEGNGEGDSQGAVLFDSTTGWAFGPMFEDTDDAQAFLDWLRSTYNQDARQLSDVVLGERFAAWRVSTGAAS